MREKYEKQKNENLNSIILIKSGNFFMQQLKMMLLL